MSTLRLIIIACMFTALVISCLPSRHPYRSLHVAILTTIVVTGIVIQLITDLIHGADLSHVVFGVIAMIFWSVTAYLAWRDWWKRRKKKRMLQQLGYKGRALIAKLVKSMPRPSLPPLRHPAPSPV